MEEGHGTTRIRLASALAVDVPGGDTLTGRELGSRKARTLLALLAAERGALVPLDRIVEALWPDDAPADPAANVATLVSRTRKLLGADLLTATGRSYGLTPRGPWLVDLDEAARLTTESGARSAAGEPVLAAAAARAALDALGHPAGVGRRGRRRLGAGRPPRGRLTASPRPPPARRGTDRPRTRRGRPGWLP